MKKIIGLPAFSDNYIWLIVDANKAAVIDPGDGQVVANYLQQNNLALDSILITHHHADHTGGIELLQSLFAATVYLPVLTNKTPQATVKRVKDLDTIEVLGETAHVIATPGHTLDHICYYFPKLENQSILFSGDTLFVAGCGRLFEGSAVQMLESLDKLSQLPLNTLLYCAHEYTLANLAFARAVEPENTALIDFQVVCEKQRLAGLKTVPSTLNVEKQVNPFLRIRCATIQKSVQQHSACELQDVAIFAALRQWKNEF
jgi:hydroxyacylglutathione hydrolase